MRICVSKKNLLFKFCDSKSCDSLPLCFFFYIVFVHWFMYIYNTSHIDIVEFELNLIAVMFKNLNKLPEISVEYCVNERVYG